jgi:toxin ParE1/3/4
MSFEVVFTPEAEEHLEDLEIYLARRFFAESAARYVDRIRAACNSLAMAPYRGTRRDDIRSGARMIGFERSASIYFVIEESQVVILSVCYGGRGYASAD